MMQVAELGGGTAFPKANVFVKPKKHMAVFFSYKGEDGRMDTGLTEHAGCTVLQGEKWIATSWLREGVSKQYTFENYDPSGISYIDIQIEESEQQLREKGIQFSSERLQSNSTSESCSKDEL
jgi:hypothetical protein